jgi:hypothetical protein
VPSPDDDRVVSLPLEEHTPRTVAEAGLDLDPPGPGRRRLALAVVGVLLVAVAAFVLLTGGDPAPSLVDLAPGTCFEPVVTDVAEAVDEVDCGPGTAQVVRKVRSPGAVDAPHPGDGALTLLAQGACQAEVDADRLVVAIPSPVAWADGDRTLVCTERQ